MISKADLIRVVGDPALTPAAVRLILHVATLPGHEWHEIPNETLAMLTGGGEKPIRAAKKRAVHCRYLTIRPGGRGRSDQFLFHMPEETILPEADRTVYPSLQGDLNESSASERVTPDSTYPSQMGDLNNYLAPQGELNSTYVSPGGDLNTYPSQMGDLNASGRGGLQGGLADKQAVPSSSPSPSSSPAGARTKKPTTEELDRLREFLGPHAATVDEFLHSAHHPSNWATNLWSKYRHPGGSQETFWRGVDPDRVPGILAAAMSNYATDAAGKPYAVQYFLSFLRRARDYPEGKPAVGSSRPAAGSEAAAVAADQRREAPGAGRRRQLGEQTGLTLLGVVAGSGPAKSAVGAVIEPRRIDLERIREWEEEHPAERDRLRSVVAARVAKEAQGRSLSEVRLRQLGEGMYQALVLQHLNGNPGRTANG